jgi:hypothetical protein
MRLFSEKIEAKGWIKEVVYNEAGEDLWHRPVLTAVTEGEYVAGTVLEIDEVPYVVIQVLPSMHYRYVNSQDEIIPIPSILVKKI